MRGGDSDNQTVFCDLNLVNTESSDKAMQFKTRALKSLLQPIVELIGMAVVEHLPKALCESVDQGQVSTTALGFLQIFLFCWL